MIKAGIIVKDAVILLAGSTLFVVVINGAFSPLEKRVARESDPIVTAVVQNNAESVRRLLDGGAGTGIRDPFGRTVLMRVGYANYSDSKLIAETDAKREPMVGLLADKSARIDAHDHDGWTPLMWASWSGLPRVAGALLKLGAAIDVPDRRGNTALTLAAQRGNAKIVELLLAAGANRAAATVEGKTALDLARLGLEEYPARKAGYNEIITGLQRD